VKKYIPMYCYKNIKIVLKTKNFIEKYPYWKITYYMAVCVLKTGGGLLDIFPDIPG